MIFYFGELLKLWLFNGKRFEAFLYYLRII